MRISVVRRFPGRRVGIGSICLSLFLLGLIDNAALTPIAAISAGHRRADRLGAGRA